MRTFAFAVALLLANAEAQANRGTYNSQNEDYNNWLACKEETGTTCDDKYEHAQAYNFCYALNDNCDKKPTRAGGYWHDCYWYNVGCEEAPAATEMKADSSDDEDKKKNDSSDDEGWGWGGDETSDDEDKKHKKHDSDSDWDDHKAHSGAATLAATIVALGAASLAF